MNTSLKDSSNSDSSTAHHSLQQQKMCSSRVRTGRLLLQFVLYGLCISVVGLITKAFVKLSKDRKRTRNDIPGGSLHTKSIVGVGIALLIITSLASALVLPQSMYIMKDRLGPKLKKKLVARFTTKSMTITVLLMAPINVAQTIITATGSGRITSNILSDSMVQTLLVFSGDSLKYRDKSTVVDYTILAWVLWFVLLVGIVVEVSTDVSKDAPVEKLKGSVPDTIR